MKRITLPAQYIVKPLPHGVVIVSVVFNLSPGGNVTTIENFVKVESDFETAMNTVKALQA